jgi:hypothetical protein
VRQTAAVRNPRACNRAAVAAAAAVIAVTTAVSAHRQDEYLQAARLAIDPGGVEIELAMTPGIAVAESVIAEIDRDHDGSLSPGEREAYVALVLEAIDLEVDGRRVPLGVVGSRFPELDAMRHGEGTIVMRSAGATLSQPGAHHALFRNRHRPEISVYLANALIPTSERLSIDGQRRDPDQRELRVDYVVRANASRASIVWLLIVLVAGAWTSYLLLQRPRTS